MLEIGDRIRILWMEGEEHYTNREGVVESLGEDPWGKKFVRGTWGGLSLYPEVDKYEVLN